jgi:hypothetical protein
MSARDRYTEYKIWEKKVNNRMNNLFGLTLESIPDMPTYSWFSDNMSVEEAVETAIEYTKNEAWW